MNLTELKKHAEAATPGPWKLGGDGMSIFTDADLTFKPMIAVTSVPDLNLADCRANASLIAAANPQAILQMIAGMEQMAAALTKYERRQSHEDLEYAGYAGETALAAYKEMMK